MQSYQEKDIKSNSESDQFITRVPISILNKETKHTEKGRSEKLSALREKIPEGYKIGAAVGAGDCFFDSLLSNQVSPLPTVGDGNCFFHAVFGDVRGCPQTSKSSIFPT